MKLYLLSLYRESSDIVNQIKYLQDGWHRTTRNDVNFVKAEINLDLDNFNDDPHKDGFYPLRLYAITPYNDELILMCSEFRVGSHETPCLRLIECLEYLGFTLTDDEKKDIYSKRKIDMTLWNEKYLIETDF